MSSAPFFVHPSSVCDTASVGAGTRIWHFCHVMAGSTIGADCVLGQGCFVASGVIVGDRVRIQNHVSLFEGVVLEDEVFCGPSVVFTNVSRPRATRSQRNAYQRTLVQRGATIGANATVCPGLTVGAHAFVAAGAVVTKSISPFCEVAGVPARPVAWVSRAGQRLNFSNTERARCPLSEELYELVCDANGVQVVSLL